MTRHDININEKYTGWGLTWEYRSFVASEWIGRDSYGNAKGAISDFVFSRWADDGYIEPLVKPPVEKFSSGKWYLNTICNHIFTTADMVGNVVCLSPNSCMAASKEHWPANVALIVTAPKLYAELKRIDPQNPLLAEARGEA